MNTRTTETGLTIPNTWNDDPMNYPAIGHLDIACYLMGACMIVAMAKIIIPGGLPEISWFGLSAYGVWGYPTVHSFGRYILPKLKKKLNIT